MKRKLGLLLMLLMLPIANYVHFPIQNALSLAEQNPELIINYTGALQEDLVAHWDFNEGSGSTLKDQSGHNHVGTIYGAQWGSGMSSTALGFDGMDDYVEVADTDLLDITSHITFEVFVFVKAGAGSEWVGLINKAPDYTDSADSYELSVNTRNNHIHFVLYFEDYGRKEFNSPHGAVTYDTWLHIACTYDGQEVAIYLNGVLNETYTASYGNIRSNDLSLVIGAEKESTTFCGFYGLIDDARIYNSALSAEEIKQSYLVLTTAPPVSTTTTPLTTSEYANTVLAILGTILILMCLGKRGRRMR